MKYSNILLGLLFVSLSSCNWFLCNKKPPVEFRNKIDSLSKVLQEEYKFRQDKCFEVLHVQCLSAKVDTARLDSIYLFINSIDKEYSTKMNVYDKDSMLHYVQYHIGSLKEGSIHKVKNYDY